MPPIRNNPIIMAHCALVNQNLKNFIDYTSATVSLAIASSSFVGTQ